jgi:F-type H+-transporting ATPase subunit b
LEGLGINLKYLIAQIVNLVLLFILLYKFLFKRVQTMLDERSARIKKGLEDAQMADQRVAEAEKAYQERTEQAEGERRAILAQATQEGEKIREEIMARAQEEAKQLVLEAQADIERQREQAMVELRQQVADLTLLAATRVIGQTLDEEAHRRLIGEFLAEVGELE